MLCYGARFIRNTVAVTDVLTGMETLWVPICPEFGLPGIPSTPYYHAIIGRVPDPGRQVVFHRRAGGLVTAPIPCWFVVVAHCAARTVGNNPCADRKNDNGK